MITTRMHVNMITTRIHVNRCTNYAFYKILFDIKKLVKNHFRNVNYYTKQQYEQANENTIVSVQIDPEAPIG